MTRTAAFDREQFVAERTPVLEAGADDLTQAIISGLEKYGEDDWADDIIDAALALFGDVVANEGVRPQQVRRARARYAAAIAESLAKTNPPEGRLDGTDPQVRQIADWLATASINAGTSAAADADGEDVQWVSMHDSDVRASHREVDGTRVPAGATFKVDGHDLHYPGEPVGPLEVWFNCRCVLRPALGGDMATITAAAPAVEEEDTDLDPDAPEISEDDLDVGVPFYGVMAPEGVPTGDGRIFDVGALRWSTPMLLREVALDVGAHQGAQRMGVIDNAWRDEATSLIKYEGHFPPSADAERVVTQIVDGLLTGVSVDLDDATFEMRNADGSAFDFEAYMPGDPEPVMAVTDARIRALTAVDVPAFIEAFIAIGTWADHDAKAGSPETLEDGFECETCDVASALSHLPAEHLAEFEAAFGPHDDSMVGFEHHAEDGTVYVFDTDGLHVFTPADGIEFAPGTHDGPGWITHPRATARIRRYWVHGKGAAKIRWGQPGDFNRCRRQLAKYVKNPDWLAGLCANMHKEALGVWPGREVGKHSTDTKPAAAFSLVASGSIESYPREWFDDPHFTSAMPITVTAEGRVFGHLAEWGTCHIGLAGHCVTPPESQNGYADFHLHGVGTTEGIIPCGVLTMGTGHAGDRLRAAAAVAHYDNTGTLAAKVRAGEDDFGIWVSGVVRPGLTEDERFALFGATLSGDWREKAPEQMELVAALVVNVPGFPIPRTTVASKDGEQITLTAAGVLHPREAEAPVPATVDVGVLATQVADTLARRERAARLRAQTRSLRTEAARAALRGE